MSDSKRLRRRYALGLGISMAILIVAIVLYFRTTGLARWLVVLAGLSNVMVFGHLRKAQTREPDSPAPA